MKDDLNQIKSAVGDVPEAQKQDNTQQACADMCATNEDNIIKIRKEIAKHLDGDEEKAAEYMNNLMTFQDSAVNELMMVHKQALRRICSALNAQNAPVSDMLIITQLLNISVVYNILCTIEKQEIKLKMDPIAGKMLEVMRSAKYFATIDFGKLHAKKTG